MTTTYRPITDPDVPHRLAVAIEQGRRIDARRSFVTTCCEDPNPDDVASELTAWVRGKTGNPKARVRAIACDSTEGQFLFGRYLLPDREGFTLTVALALEDGHPNFCPRCGQEIGTPIQLGRHLSGCVEAREAMSCQ